MATRSEFLLRREERVSREVQSSLYLAPRRPGAGKGEVEYDEYWTLSPTQRLARKDALRSMPPQSSLVAGPGALLIYEAQQAPLYYWMVAPVYSLVRGAPFLVRVWSLRLFSLLIASTVIPITFLIASELFGCGRRALATAAIVTAMPQLMMSVNHIGNESLSIPMGALFLFLLLKWKRQPSSWHATVALALVIGLALLTKAYFIAILPAAVLLAVIWSHRYRVFRQAFVLILSPLIISGWWYVRTAILTHTLSGEQIEIAGAQAGSRSGVALLQSSSRINWVAAVDFAFLSHLWMGNWSFLVVRSWIYHFFAGCALVAGGGLVVNLLTPHRTRVPLRSDLLLLLGIWASFALALAYQATRNFQLSGFPGTMGYYLLAVVAAEAILLVAGLEQIVPRTLAAAVVPCAVSALAGLELFGINFYSIPYYVGWIRHFPDGRLPALRLGQFAAGGFREMFARLADNKPELLGPTVIAASWSAFVIATFGLVALTIWASAQTHRGMRG